MNAQTLKPTSQSIRPVLALSLTLLISACGDSGDGLTHPWYSNGYVLKSAMGYDIEGQLTETESCSWSAAEITLVCEESDVLYGSQYNTITTLRYNEDERIVTETETDAGNYIDETTYTYKDNRIFERQYTLTYSNSSQGPQHGATQRYLWQGDELRQILHYEGEFPVPEDESGFSMHAVEWRDGRVHSVEQISTQDKEFSDPLLRSVYSYNAQNKLYRLEQSYFDTSGQEWTFSYRIDIDYSADSNVQTVTSSNAENQTVSRTEYTWQPVKTPVENPFLISGIEHL